jgi:hypothetical protein
MKPANDHAPPPAVTLDDHLQNARDAADSAWATWITYSALCRATADEIELAAALRDRLLARLEAEIRQTWGAAHGR